MADYKKIDLQIGTEEQFEEKKLSLPVGTLVGITDPIHESELDTDLKNEINGKYTKPSTGIPKTDLASAVQTSLGKADSAIQKPSTPTAESAITINSSGTVSTKPLSSITGKTEVYVGSTTPTNPDEILWIDPNGTGGGGGGKLYSYRLYNLQLSPYDQTSSAPIVYVNLQFYLPYITEIYTYEKLRVVCEKIYGESTYIPVTFHSAYSDTYYSGALYFYKGDNYVRFFFGGISNNASGSGLTALEYSSTTNTLRPAFSEGKKQWSDTVNLSVTEL